jgi:hypothetical protein
MFKLHATKAILKLYIKTASHAEMQGADNFITYLYQVYLAMCKNQTPSFICDGH